MQRRRCIHQLSVGRSRLLKLGNRYSAVCAVYVTHHAKLFRANPLALHALLSKKVNFGTEPTASLSPPAKAEGGKIITAGRR